MEMSPSDRGFPTPSPSASPERDGSESRRKRRRTSLDDPSTPGARSVLDADDEEDVPESAYDLSKERLGEGMQVEKRLEGKIRKCFQQFLLKFVPDGQTEPQYPDLLRKMAEEYQAHLDVSFSHLQQWSPNLALWITEEPSKILPVLNETLLDEAVRKFETYRLIRETEENQLRVAIHSFP